MRRREAAGHGTDVPPLPGEQEDGSCWPGGTGCPWSKIFCDFFWVVGAKSGREVVALQGVLLGEASQKQVAGTAASPYPAVLLPAGLGKAQDGCGYSRKPPVSSGHHHGHCERMAAAAAAPPGSLGWSR